MEDDRCIEIVMRRPDLRTLQHRQNLVSASFVSNVDFFVSQLRIRKPSTVILVFCEELLYACAIRRLVMLCGRNSHPLAQACEKNNKSAHRSSPLRSNVPLEPRTKCIALCESGAHCARTPSGCWASRG